MEGQCYLVGISRSLLFSGALGLAYCGNQRQPLTPYFQVPSGGGLPLAEDKHWGCEPQPPVGHWWAGVKVPLRLGPEVLEPGMESTETKITSLCNENKEASLLGLGPHEFNPCCISDCPAVITVGKMGSGFTWLSQGHPKKSK